jgi:hypothetical protein
MRTFEKRCAPSKAVRTFEPGHRQGTALDPVPLTRKVAQAPASALRLSTNDLGFHFTRQSKTFRDARARQILRQVMIRVIREIRGLFLGRRANKKSRASSETRLRLCEIYSLWPYRRFLAVLCAKRASWFKIDFYEGRAQQAAPEAMVPRAKRKPETGK